MQALRRRMRKAHEHCAAGGRGDANFRRFPQNVGGIGIGKDKPGVVWDDIDGHARGYGKVEFVAMGAVFPLFGIGAKIGDGGFDLDDDNRGVHGKRDDIGAPSREQRQFGDGRKIQAPQQTPGAARDSKRRLRLAAILRRRGLGKVGMSYKTVNEKPGIY